MNQTDFLEANPDLIANIKRAPVTPVTLRKTLLLLTRLHYSAASNFGEFAERFEKYVYDESATPKLFIDLDYNYNPKDTEHRPAIFVGCGKFVYDQTVFDGRVEHTRDLAGEEFYNRGYTQAIIRHVGASADESLALGDLSAQFFRGIRKIMQNELGFTRYVVKELDSTKPFDKRPEQADQQFVADLVIDMAFNTNWMIWTESHRLKDWSFSDVLKHVGSSQVDWKTSGAESPDRNN